ncbi:MarR family winged helix-turn-helix transcriptional regulator [Actinoplanes sp. NEAU-A12]|uniref:MarR family winged helix-turn-helix transcriptional regulator n=1 Tax=Actinoplanes sandaracinus TaxID=3045177 RepID=A0ABT6WPP5_9ACTN|nr:MarR family winged helix-turn-helix transcriptional regulator [Actinoplanes sandaracinus]MDI6101654.1 MarR family winged helix-turn-helix transcriptional regulator [Actinoplanes sandaracinus]
MIGETPLTLYLVKQLESAIRARLDTTLRQYRITTVQYTALSVLQHRGDLSSAQLARRSFVRAQTMHETVVGLERQGLIERHPSPDRKHVLLARLTPTGQTKLAECRAETEQIEKDMLRGLTCSDATTLRELLDRCHHALAHPPGDDIADDAGQLTSTG